MNIRRRGGIVEKDKEGGRVMRVMDENETEDWIKNKYGGLDKE